MATVKNTSDDYTITVADGLGTLTINANLDVFGSITYIDSTELRVSDPFITVAYDNNGTIQSMGLVAQKSTTTFAGLRFNTVSGDWEVSPAVDADGGAITPYSTISTGGISPGAPFNAVQYNGAGTFSGDAAFTFDAGNAKVNITGQLVLANIVSTPAATPNVAALYNKAEGSGGTGIYVISPTVDDELVSKTKAIVFGIIF
mgnify:CR=1 FL=1|tara:strand:+ start:796 stop:1401 length:606 start_codon:yes stop_codon:yes gene_type:complete